MKVVFKLWCALVLAAGAAAQAPDTTEDKKPGSIEGIVVNRMTGEPLARAHVHIAKDLYSDEGSYGAITTQDGRFSIRGVAPGDYQVSVERQRFIWFSAKTED